MSAKRDWDFPVHFYYGNAAHDLSHLIPVEDEKEVSAEARLSSIESIIGEIENSQAQISYYLRDLLRVTH